MAHLRFIDDQIRRIKDERLKQLKWCCATYAITSAVARYAGLTGSADEIGSRRREKGFAKAGNARVRRGMIQLAWRFLLHQKDGAVTKWYQASVASGKKRKTMVVALARKLLIALWRFVTAGDARSPIPLCCRTTAASAASRRSRNGCWIGSLARMSRPNACAPHLRRRFRASWSRSGSRAS
jgi:Transposase IS116/IS110/IS902 family